MKNFGITGVAGFVAPRHLKAIKETGNRLITCFDPHDSVGILDHYFPHAEYFTEYERFERHLYKLERNSDTKIDYLTVCSPNHFHDSHIRLALNVGADAICEKPLVLSPQNLDLLQEFEEITQKKVYAVMQLRYHPLILSLKNQLHNSYAEKKHKVELTYITSRGNWYHYAWKGNDAKSGGIATNIGIHLFDLLIWLFGSVERSEVHLSEKNKMAGFLELENADVVWFLSIDENDLPDEIRLQKKSIHRSIKVDDKEIEFTDGFTELHTKVYQEILNGKGLGIDDARPAIEIVYNIRFAKIYGGRNFIHPLITKVKLSRGN